MLDNCKLFIAILLTYSQKSRKLLIFWQNKYSVILFGNLKRFESLNFKNEISFRTLTKRSTSVHDYTVYKINKISNTKKCVGEDWKKDVWIYDPDDKSINIPEHGEIQNQGEFQGRNRT